MKLPFSDHVPDYYYEMALEEADSLLQLSPRGDSPLSIKVRPIKKWPMQSKGEFANAYVYPFEYASVNRALQKAPLVKCCTGMVGRGRAKEYRVPASGSFLFVEHESGPEIVAYLSLENAAKSLVGEVVLLIKQVMAAVNDGNETKKQQSDCSRYHEAAAISIEARTFNGANIIAVIPLPLQPDDSDIQIVESALLTVMEKQARESDVAESVCMNA